MTEKRWGPAASNHLSPNSKRGHLPAGQHDRSGRQQREDVTVGGQQRRFLAGIVGVVGALLPAMDGQKVGDPDSVAFRLGVPLGLFGGLVAVVIGALVMSRSPSSAFSRGVAIASLVVGSIALFLTVALAFSG